MSAGSEPISEVVSGAGTPDFGELFRTFYARIARVIARVVNDPGQAEELAAEVFLKFAHTPGAQSGNPGGWLYRAAVRQGLDELRRRRRREKYSRLLSLPVSAPSPQQLHEEAQEQQRVRAVLASLKRRDSEMLILRSEGLSYEEVAVVLCLQEASIGTLLRRAQQAFRKEYVKRYGHPQ